MTTPSLDYNALQQDLEALSLQLEAKNLERAEEECASMAQRIQDLLAQISSDNPDPEIVFKVQELVNRLTWCSNALADRQAEANQKILELARTLV